MFDLDPGEELGLVAETARKFAAEELAPRLREAEAARAVAKEVRRGYTGIGLAGLEVPEGAGGAGLGAVARVLVNEELAAADAGAALALDPFGPALYPALEMGGEAAVGELAGLLAKPGARAICVCDDDAEVVLRGDQVSASVASFPSFDRWPRSLIVCASSISTRQISTTN